jgi:hypothetical protein
MLGPLHDVVAFQHLFFDISRHSNIEIALDVIPREGDATV